MRVSNSKVNTYRRCPKRYQFKYIDKLVPRSKSLPLERGSWIHELLQTYYDGEDWVAKHKELSKDFYNLLEEMREELGDLPDECYRIMKAYIRHWREVDNNFVVVDSELNEIVPLANGHEMVIIVDLVLEDRRSKLLWAWDHKTRKSFENIENMMMDPQLTHYFSGLEQMGYAPMAGVTYNEIRTKPPTVPAVLKKGGLSQAQNIDTDVYTYMKAIRDNDLDPADYMTKLQYLARTRSDSFFRRQSLPKDPPVVRTMRRDLIRTIGQIQADEATKHFPRTFDKSCRWGCDFQNLCLAQLHGADISSLVKLNFRKRGQVD